MVARVFVEDGWIMGRRIVEEVEPNPLPGAPTMGAEAGAARWFAERLEDVRVAAALLQAAAEHVELAILNEPSRFGRLVPAQPWTRPVIAALEPLKRIGEACAAFEEAVAGAGAHPADVERVLLPNDARDIPADLARTATFAVPIASEGKIFDRRVTPGAGNVAIAAAAHLAALPDERTQEIVGKAMATAEAARPYIDAVDRVAPALAKAEAVRRYADAIDRAAPLIAAVDALGPHARLTSLTSREAAAAAIASARALSAAELADLDRIGREDAAIRGLAEAHERQKDLY
jgi:hypothetical protein